MKEYPEGVRSESAIIETDGHWKPLPDIHHEWYISHSLFAGGAAVYVSMNARGQWVVEVRQDGEILLHDNNRED